MTRSDPNRLIENYAKSDLVESAQVSHGSVRLASLLFPFPHPSSPSTPSSLLLGVGGGCQLVAEQDLQGLASGSSRFWARSQAFGCGLIAWFIRIRGDDRKRLQRYALVQIFPRLPQTSKRHPLPILPSNRKCLFVLPFFI